MTTDRRVLVHRDKQTLAGSVAARFLTKTIDILDDLGTANVVLTGGTMGAATLKEIGGSSAAGALGDAGETGTADTIVLPDGVLVDVLA